MKFPDEWVEMDRQMARWNKWYKTRFVLACMFQVICLCGLVVAAAGLGVLAWEALR